MTASLMMYAHPALAQPLARFWTQIRAALAARGIDAPATLAQDGAEFSVWEDPAMVLSQTCGMPYRQRLHRRVQLVGTPDFGLEGCAPGYYRSVIVVRADDARDRLAAFSEARMVYNMAQSQSGFAAFHAHVHPLGWWFSDRKQSGSHLASARMVAEGRADIAALDAQSWRMIRRFEPWADTLRVLDRTAPTPGLPYITGPEQDAGAVFAAVQDAIGALQAQDRTALDLHGIVAIPKATYLAVPNPPAGAA